MLAGRVDGQGSRDDKGVGSATAKALRRRVRLYTYLSLCQRQRSDSHLLCRLKFLPLSPDAQQLAFRSTNMSRTIESLQQVIVGLYPLSTRPPTYRADINIRNMTEESLLPNTFSCKRLRDLDKQFARAAALAWNDTLKPLDKKLSKYIDGKPIRIVSFLSVLTEKRLLLIHHTDV